MTAMLRRQRASSLLVVFAFFGVLAAPVGAAPANNPATAIGTPANVTGTVTAIFAGGCFWCTEADFEKLPGVVAAESGYTGGSLVNPNYQQVSAGITGHTEAVRVVYDPTKVSYRQLVEYFWRTIDPTVKDRQFCDAGSQYRSAIFWNSEAEQKEVEASLGELRRSKRFKEVYTQVVKAGTFYPAEDYHQDYYKKNPVRYSFYRQSCGRDARLAEVWGGK